MSTYKELSKIQQKLTESYSAIIESIDMSGIIEVSNALVGPLIQNSELKSSLAKQESLLDSVKLIQSSLNIMVSRNKNIFEPMQDIVRSIQPNIKIMNAHISLLQENYSEMISSLGDKGYNLTEIVQQACLEIDNDLEDYFRTNEEIIEALQEQADNPRGFQEKVMLWTESKKKRYYIIVSIILFIWINFFQPYFQETIGIPVTAFVVSKVKELPEAAGKIIGELNKDRLAFTTEDVPYYYKVSYIDEDGNTKEGYVAKKNLKILEDSEDNE